MSDADIAIIGMAARLPGARTLDALWAKLASGLDAVARFDVAEPSVFVSDADRERPDLVKAAAILGDVDQFAASFFRISNEDAALLDPQHRVLLECAWEALESAGWEPSQCGEGAGVFVGTSVNRYLLQILGRRPELLRSASAIGPLLGADKDFAASRISYALGLTGPSVAVQTACSSSLVSVHMACQSLVQGECDLALAGGASVAVPERGGYVAVPGGLLSPDGRTYVFDDRAHGAGKGSGAAIVVLKRRADAERDDDFIWAVIKGSAVNNDGGARVAYAAPGLAGQADVVEEALAIAGVDAESVTYVEAHGSGTRFGDAVEIAALRRGLAGARTCALGAVRATFGSLDVATGVVGLIKTALALHHATLPPTPNYARPNAEIDFGPFVVNDVLRPWLADVRRAGVSSFGVGGTNAHVVLEAAPARPAARASGEEVILVSAATDTALALAEANLAAHLRAHPELALSAVASTLRVGRRVFARRRAIAVTSLDEAIRALEGGAVERRDSAGARAAERWQRGEAVDVPGGAIARVPLPTYPFERERCWFDTDAPRPAPAAAPAVARAASVVEEMIARLFAEALNVARVDVDRNVFELGVTSLMVAKVVERLKSEHGITVPVVALFEHVTIRALAASLEARPADDEDEWAARRRAGLRARPRGDD